MKRGVRWVHTYGTGIERFPFDVIGDRLLTCRAAPARSQSRSGSWPRCSRRPSASPSPGYAKLPSAGPGQSSTGSTGERSASSESAASASPRPAAHWPSGCGCARSAASRRRAHFPRSSSPSDLYDLLGSSDHLVVAAPATSATRHLARLRGLCAREARRAPGQHRARSAHRSGRHAGGSGQRSRLPGLARRVRPGTAPGPATGSTRTHACD